MSTNITIPGIIKQPCNCGDGEKKFKMLYPNLLPAEHYITKNNTEMRLELDTFSHLNAKRAREATFGKDGMTLDTLPSIYWGNALAGETGELCNMLKKIHLGKTIPVEEVMKEIADVVTYADLICTKLGGKLSDVLASKFNEVSDRYNSAIKIPDYGS